MKNFKITYKDTKTDRAPQLVGFATITNSGSIQLPVTQKFSVTEIAELQSAVRLLRIETAVKRIELVSGYEVTREPLKFVNNESLWGTRRN